MRFFAFQVEKPNAGSLKPETAFVSCWINSPDRSEAFLRAERMILDQGWTIAEMLEDQVVSDKDYPEEKEATQYYKQALVDDEVIVFYVVRDQGRSAQADP